MADRGDFLVETDWLHDHLDEYAAAHIPGAGYLDWSTDIVDPDDEIPVQIATATQFTAAMGRIGVGDEHLVIAYDTHPASTFATRLWWALRYYGHTRVAVLNGGFAKWQREGRPVSSVLPGQYTGSVVRPGNRAGHIPGAINIPREDLVDPATGTWRSTAELTTIFAGLSPDRPIVAYCNGGVAAATVQFGLTMAGFPLVANYDGSWNEWSAA